MYLVIIRFFFHKEALFLHSVTNLILINMHFKLSVFKTQAHTVPFRIKSMMLYNFVINVFRLSSTVFKTRTPTFPFGTRLGCKRLILAVYSLICLKTTFMVITTAVRSWGWDLAETLCIYLILINKCPKVEISYNQLSIWAFIY